ARIARPGRPLAVALEHSDRTVDKRCLLGPTPEAVAFADEIRRDHPSFGLVMDLSHLRLLEEGPREAVLTAEGRIVLAHVANCVAGEPENPLFGDKHPPFGVPGSSVGVGAVAGFLSALREAGYLRNEPLGRPATVSLEIKSPPGARPETVLADAKRVLRQAGAMLEEGSR
ncbi:MAG: sugar phosphate isomerase/epimerase, partial [Methanocella sp.]